MKQQIEAVRRMQDYIDKHLCEDITPADLSGAAMYSPWYSYRLFVKWLNITPSDYIRRLRLSKSALRLRDERVRVIDVAFDAGFSSVDGYQRAFLREFNRNPHEYAKSPVPIHLFTPYRVQSSEREKEKTMENVKNVFIREIEKPARKALIKRGIKAEDYFSYCGEVGCDIWGLLVSMKSIGGEPVCMWLPDKHISPGTSRYVQGVEVEQDYAGDIPEGFDIIELDKARYLVFQGEPFAEEDYEQAIGEVQSAIEKFDPSSIGRSWDSSNPRIQLEPVGSRGYMELLPIK